MEEIGIGHLSNARLAQDGGAISLSCPRGDLCIDEAALIALLPQFVEAQAMALQRCCLRVVKQDRGDGVDHVVTHGRQVGPIHALRGLYVPAAPGDDLEVFVDPLTIPQ